MLIFTFVLKKLMIQKLFVGKLLSIIEHTKDNDFWHGSRHIDRTGPWILKKYLEQ